MISYDVAEEVMALNSRRRRNTCADRIRRLDPFQMACVVGFLLFLMVILILLIMNYIEFST
jgi:hypothetical protein